MISQIMDQLGFCHISQNHSHTKNILSKYHGEFRKKFSSQHSLLAMFEKWKERLNNGGSCGALLLDF